MEHVHKGKKTQSTVRVFEKTLGTPGKTTKNSGTVTAGATLFLDPLDNIWRFATGLFAYRSVPSLLFEQFMGFGFQTENSGSDLVPYLYVPIIYLYTVYRLHYIDTGHDHNHTYMYVYIYICIYTYHAAYYVSIIRYNRLWVCHKICL